MDSMTKMPIREKSQGLTCYFLFFSFFSPSPSHLPFPCPSFLPALGENYLRIYTPDSLLSCIIRLIPKFLSSFAFSPLIHFFHFLSPHIFSSFISKFVLLFSFLFPPFPLLLPFPLSFILPFLLPFLLPFPSFSLFFDFLP